MTDKLSEKDKKDWKKFLDSSEKLEVKDEDNQTITKTNIERVIDLHGHTLKEANIKIKEFIDKCFNEKIKKVHDIWKFSKDSRSTNPNWILIDTQA